MVPTGGELGTHSAANHLWTRVLTCGWCAIWNGSVQGGFPALADTVSSALHPVVMIATLLFGVVNGVKVTMLVALWLTGIAQWWMAKELKLAAPARLWSSGIAVAGGHLASRMEIGNYQFLLATAAASLFIAGILAMARRGGSRLAVVAGLLLASFLLSGQAYLQLGFVALAPAVAFLLFENGWRAAGRWKDFLVAGVVGLLLAAPFIVPMLHFLPNFAKDIDLSGFGAAQPVAFMPLNLVINDGAFYSSDALGKLPYVQLYSLYIGWVPVLLAAVGLATLKKSDRRAGWFLALGACLAFLASGPVILRWIFKFWIGIGAIRWPSLFSTLSVPLILALSAYGLDQVLIRMRSWPRITLGLSDDLAGRRLGLPLQWILIIPLALSLRSVQSFASQWYKVTPMPDAVYATLAAMRTSTLQWVSPPWGTQYFIQAGVQTGLKLSPVWLPYRWNNREATSSTPRGHLRRRTARHHQDDKRRRRQYLHAG